MSVSTDRLEALFREQSPRLWRSLFSFTGDPDVASDALGEAFAQALARGDAIRDASAWVWRVAFIVARGEMKRRPTPTLAPQGSYEMPDRQNSIHRPARGRVTRQFSMTGTPAECRVVPTQSRSAVALR